ncbi:hypothetical protein [Acinetobacter baumannii]|uniref:hypothetical protein n=1 Tax=Acinetobacter baumannii TaxID=470 RepID=UPI000DF3145D|nr:hypothetical protein [Acinetobacter baumannii]RCT89660.1 hypothetical protein DVA68_15780 [Acinetobacter baumannii]
MLKYLKKLFGVPDLKIYELPKDERTFLAIPTRSSKGVGFSVPPHCIDEQYQLENDNNQI